MPDTEQPILGQDPQAAAPGADPVATPSEVQPQSQGHPWDTDLSFIPDEGVRSQVSKYLADTWQPRVTQLEQSSKPAVELYNDFSEKPKDTLVEVAEELYGKDVATAFKGYLDEIEGSQESPQVPQATAEQAERDPEVQAIIDWKRQQDEEAAFNAEFKRVQEANPAIPFDRELYMNAVAETGDFDRAVEAYTTKYSDYLNWRASQDAANQPPPEAPPVLGTSEAQGHGEVQTERPNQTLDEAIDDYFNEQAVRGNTGAPAPPVATG